MRFRAFETVVVVGMHGGQLYNALFAPEGSHLVEINSWPQLGGAGYAFWMMTEMWGQHYTRYMVPYRIGRPMVVDVARFSTWFRAEFVRAGHSLSLAGR